LTGSGQGMDAQGLDDKERAVWRQQALDWLRADLAAHAKELERGQPEARSLARKQLQHWQKNADLVGLRDQKMVDKLPAEERQACQQLWGDVEALLEKAEQKTK